MVGKVFWLENHRSARADFKKLPGSFVSITNKQNSPDVVYLVSRTEFEKIRAMKKTGVLSLLCFNAVMG